MAKLVDRSENSNDKVFVVLGPLLYCSNMWCVPGSAVILCLLALYACVRACCGVCVVVVAFSWGAFVCAAVGVAVTGVACPLCEIIDDVVPD